MQVTVELSPEPEDIDAVTQFLVDANFERAGQDNFEPLFVALRDEIGTIAGGVIGETYWGWLYVDNLSVRTDLRGQGFGGLLLAAAEDEARKRGCRHAFLDTFSFQARPFYEKHGYKIAGTLDDFPAGHQRFFLTKDL